MPINALSFALMMRMLMDDEVTKSGLVEAIGLHHITVSRYLNQLHRKRVVRISAYYRDKRGQGWVPHYTLNHDGLPDAKRPPKQTSATKSQAYRDKQRMLKQIAMLAAPLQGEER